MKRRQLLQFTGATLATLGLNQWEIRHDGLKYAKTLAQETSRKRALLIGINEYPGSIRGEWLPLRGAVTDVMLQQELLTKRFGFHPSNIILLKDGQAERNAILAAFKDLIQWAKPGDVVVIHFSGHGSTIHDPHHIFQDGFSGTIVPVDSPLPPQGGAVNDISSGTLFLLMSALQTENVTVILDSCYSGGGVRGNLVFRSRRGQAELTQEGTGLQLSVSQGELNYQREWLSRLKLSESDWITQRKKRIAKGVTLLATQRDQKAADVVFAGDAYAGAFTYSLTRHLWEITDRSVVTTVMSNVKAKTEHLVNALPSSDIRQTPTWEVTTGNDQKPIYFTPSDRVPADAVITQVNGNQVKVLLTTDPQTIEAFGKGATLKLVDRQGQEVGIVELESRQQLIAQGRLKRSTNQKITSGMRLQEQIRAVPKTIKLNIGLDESLQSERTTVTTLLNAMPRVEAVSLLKHEIHYILGRVTAENRKRWQSTELSFQGIGLFSRGLEPIPGSFGQPNETISDAIARLTPKLRSLLAARILRLMLNAESSKLKVSAAIQSGDSTLVGQAFTIRGGSTRSSIQPAPTLTIGQGFRVIVQNQDVRDLYVAIVLASPEGELLIASPQTDDSAAGLLEARQEMQIEVERITPPAGVGEVLVIASTTPLKAALRTLRLITSNDRTSEVMTDLLDGLDTTRSHSTSGVSQVRTSDIAALSMTFDIIAEG
jgi:hypothetical protein